MCACVHAWQHHLQLDTLWQAASPLCAFLTGEAEVTAVLSWSGCCRGMRHKGLPVLPVLVTAPQAHAVSFLTSTRRATKDKAAPPLRPAILNPAKQHLLPWVCGLESTKQWLRTLWGLTHIPASLRPTVPSAPVLTIDPDLRCSLAEREERPESCCLLPGAELKRHTAPPSLSLGLLKIA